MVSVIREELLRPIAEPWNTEFVRTLSNGFPYAFERELPESGGGESFSCSSVREWICSLS